MDVKGSVMGGSCPIHPGRAGATSDEQCSELHARGGHDWSPSVMASPSYGIDVVALAFAVILAAALALLLSRLLPQLAGYL